MLQFKLFFDLNIKLIKKIEKSLEKKMRLKQVKISLQFQYLKMRWIFSSTQTLLVFLHPFYSVPSTNLDPWKKNKKDYIFVLLQIVCTKKGIPFNSFTFSQLKFVHSRTITLFSISHDIMRKETSITLKGKAQINWFFFF